MPHTTLAQREQLAPWLLRAGGAATEAVLRDVRDSFAQLQASSPAQLDANTHPQLPANSLAQLQRYLGERPPVLAAAARKVQTWYFRAAAKAWAPGLPSTERLRFQAQTAPLEDAAGAWPEPLEEAAQATPTALNPSASAAQRFRKAYWGPVTAAEAAGTALDSATAQDLERTYMALALDERAGLLQESFWLGTLCLATPGCLARLIQGQPPEVRAGVLGQAAVYGPELIAEWAPLLLADRVQLEDYTPLRFTTPPKSAAQRQDNLQRLNRGLDALKALAVHFPDIPLRMEPLNVALYAGLEGLQAAAPVFGFDVREVAQQNEVIQALFMAAAPEACAKLLGFVRPPLKGEALAWTPLEHLMKHVGPEQLLALMQAQPPTTTTETHLYLEAALAGRVDLLNLIREHSRQPDALMTTPILGHQSGGPAQSLLDCFASPFWQTVAFFSDSRSWSPEVFEHLTRAALTLPPNFPVPAAAAAAWAIDGDDRELLRALNARAPLTPDDWWHALHVSTRAKPSMLRAVSEHLAGAGPAHAASEANTDAKGVLCLRRQRVFELMRIAGGEWLNAMADLFPGATATSYNVAQKSGIRDLARLTALRELTLTVRKSFDLRTLVAKLPAVETLRISTFREKQNTLEGWGALAALPQLAAAHHP